MKLLLRILCLVLLTFAFAAPALAQTAADLFDDTVVHDLHIEINPKDWTLLKNNPSSDQYYVCNVKWRNVEVDNVGIRQRGGASRSIKKPGVRLDFNHYDDKQAFLGLKALGLDNMLQDPSLIKERVVFKLFAAMGLPASREVSARVYVNGEYYGVYSVIEAIDKDYLKRYFGENDGYLYEFQGGGGYHFEWFGSDPALYSPRFFDPKTHESKPNPTPLVDMIRTMNFASDADYASAMAPYLDLPLFMKHLALEDYMAEVDGILTGMNNFDLYRFEDKTLSQFIVKDKDQTFGGGPVNSNRWATPFLAYASKNVLIRRAMTVPAAHDSYFNTLKDAATFAGASGGWMESEILRMYDQIRSAAYDDVLKGTNDDFEAEIAADLEFARRRSDFLLSQMPEISGERFFALTNPGGYSLTRAGQTSDVRVGYGVVAADTPVRNPDGIAVITFQRNGVVVTDTSVPASAPVTAGMLYAENNGPVKTGVAIANPANQDARVSFFMTDADGNMLGQGVLVVPARSQIARFLDQAPFNTGGLTRGVFNFESSIPVFVIALRGLLNERSDFILSTLPVVDLSASRGTSLVPYFADGGGWTTQIVLLNPTNQPMHGAIQFFGQGGGASTPYTIAPGSYYGVQTKGTDPVVRTGYVQIAPDNNGTAPVGFGVFSFRNNGVTVTESSVQGETPAAAFRTYVEVRDNIQTGLVIANPSSAQITVTLEATLLSGAPSGMSSTFTIPANGVAVNFLSEFAGFAGIAAPFQGVLRISTNASSGIAVSGLRGRNNERGDFLISTVPSIDESIEASTTQLVFPQFAEGGGYSTQFVLFTGSPDWTPTGVLRLYDQNGLPLNSW